MNETYAEHWITFHIVGGKWQVAVWADAAQPVNAKVYRLKVKVPTELIGEVEGTVTCRSAKYPRCSDL